MPRATDYRFRYIDNAVFRLDQGFRVISAGTAASGSVTGVKGKRLLGIGGNVALKLDSPAN
jgi:hypothetical protein